MYISWIHIYIRTCISRHIIYIYIDTIYIIHMYHKTFWIFDLPPQLKHRLLDLFLLKTVCIDKALLGLKGLKGVMHIICTFKLHNQVMLTKSGCSRCWFWWLLKLVSLDSSPGISAKELTSVLREPGGKGYQSLGEVQEHKRRTKNLPGIRQKLR